MSVSLSCFAVKVLGIVCREFCETNETIRFFRGMKRRKSGRMQGFDIYFRAFRSRMWRLQGAEGYSEAGKGRNFFVFRLLVGAELRRFGAWWVKK